MPAGVIHVEAQVATALVEIQRAGLENGLVLPAIEIGEVDKVAAELRDVAMIMNQPMQTNDGGGIAFLGLVLGDQRGQSFLRLGGQDFAGAWQSNFFDRAAGLAGVPGIEGREFANECIPIQVQKYR